MLSSNDSNLRFILSIRFLNNQIIFITKSMNHFSLGRQHLHQISSHDLTQQQLASHPDQLGRILYFTIPFLVVALTTSLLQARNLRIHRNNFVKPFPSTFFANFALVVSLISAAVIGVYAILHDAWTVKLWIMFAVICAFVAFHALIYALDSKCTLQLAAIALTIAAVACQWFFIESRSISQDTQQKLGWKHATRNLIGVVQSTLIIFCVLLYTQIISDSGKSSKSDVIFFWILAPLLVIGVLVWNILEFGPFLDLIGYIAAALLLFLGAASSTLFHEKQTNSQNE